MNLLDISINSLRRRKAKMIFLVLGLVIAVGTVVTLKSLTERMNADIASSLDEFGANIIILPKSDDLSLTYGGLSVSSISFDVRTLRDEDAERIRTIKNKDNISIVAPKLVSATRIKDKNVLVVGVDFTQELRLKRWWTVSGTKHIGANDVIIGSDVQTKLGLTLNESVEIRGRQFTVAGILEPTGSADDAIIFVDLKRAQQLFGKAGQLSLIEVAALCYDCPIEQIVSQTSEKLPGAKVTAIRQTIDSKMEAMHHFEHFSVGIALIVLIVGALIVFTTMTASVNERTREIGILRAIGFRQSNVIRIILTEAFMTSVIAGILGYFAGDVITIVISPMLGVMVHSGVAIRTTLLASSIILSLVIGMGASIYPAVRASRLDPSIALKAL